MSQMPCKGSSDSTASTTATATPSSTTVTPKPVPPVSTGKKRRRRTAAQIDRKYQCNYPGCTKAYGSEGSLTQHQRLKHRQPHTEATQVIGNFLLPLHRTAGREGNRPLYPRTPGGSTRNVIIRPATMDGLSPAMPFDVNGSAMNAPEFSDGARNPMYGMFLQEAQLAPKGASVQHLRARSNSMPVSFSTGNTTTTRTRSNTTHGCTPRSSTSRRTPRVRSSTQSSRRAKSRSKSESLSEAEQLILLEDISRPVHARCVSDNTQSDDAKVKPMMRSCSFHEGDEPAIAKPSPNPFHWPPAAFVAPSNSDHEIDNDILSVLAECGSPHHSVSHSESSVALPGNDLSNATWGPSVEEASFLTDHIERMTMFQAASEPSTACNTPSFTQGGNALPGFSNVTIDSCSLHGVEESQDKMDICEANEVMYQWPRSGLPDPMWQQSSQGTLSLPASMSVPMDVEGSFGILPSESTADCAQQVNDSLKVEQDFVAFPDQSTTIHGGDSLLFPSVDFALEDNQAIPPAYLFQMAEDI